MGEGMYGHPDPVPRDPEHIRTPTLLLCICFKWSRTQMKVHLIHWNFCFMKKSENVFANIENYYYNYFFSYDNHRTLRQRQDDAAELRVDRAAQQEDRCHPQRVRRRSRRRKTTLRRKSGQNYFEWQKVPVARWWGRFLSKFLKEKNVFFSLAFLGPAN